MAYLAEAADLARELGDSWRLSQILSWQATSSRGTDARRTGHRGLRRPGWASGTEIAAAPACADAASSSIKIMADPPSSATKMRNPPRRMRNYTRCYYFCRFPDCVSSCDPLAATM